MASLEWKLVGIERTTAGIRSLANAMPSIADDVLYGWMQDVRGELRSMPYPPAPSDRYRRTGQLANRWAVKRLTRGVSAIVNNAAAKGRRYASYVIGDVQGRQAWMHRGRWWIASDEIEVRLPRLRILVDDRIAAEMVKRGL